MHTNLEREVKLTPPEDFVLPELGGETLSPRVFSSTYHDTHDLRLARHGVTLRHRVEDGKGAWQLKLPRGDARLELERPGGRPERPPHELVELLPAFLRGEPLVKVARLRTRREVVRTDGAEVLDDSVAVFDGRRISRRFRELEVELLEGDERTLRRLEKALRRAGADGGGPLRPKLFRALDLVVPEEPPELERGTPPGEALGARLREQADRLLQHDPRVRLGGDPEDVHQLRVATRRLRAFLRVSRPLVDREWADGLRDELGWLGRSFGPARDLDVLLERMRGEVAALGEDATAAAGLVEALAAERERARADGLAALSDERYFALLDRLDAIGEPPLTGADGTLAELFRSELKRARRVFATLGPVSSDDALHEGRIRVKRARYAAELAAHELGKRGERFVEAAKRLQDELGEHQDAVVAEGRVRAWADEHPEGRVAAGRLIDRFRARKREARESWPALWKKLEKLGRKA
jgi:CHAD domain-containing protein